MPDDSRVTLNRTERTLLTMAGSVFGLAVIAIIASIIGRMVAPGALTSGVWPAIELLPFIALPIVIVLVVVFLVIGTIRRRRLADGGRD